MSGFTVMVALADAVPALFVAVRVYVVVAVGYTDTDVCPDTFPTPLLIERLGTGLPDTDQDKVLDCPATMVAGVAEKAEITGP